MLLWKLEISLRSAFTTAGVAISPLQEKCYSVKQSSGLFDICLPLSDSLAGFVIKTELSL